MSCLIEAVDSDDGCGVVLEFKMQKARKEHKCHECGRTIQAGEQYRYEKGVWEGGFYTHKECADCDSLSAAYVCSYQHGSLLSVIEDEVTATSVCGEYMLDERVAKLTPAAREKLFELIEKCWEDDDD